MLSTPWDNEWEHDSSLYLELFNSNFKALVFLLLLFFIDKMTFEESLSCFIFAWSMLNTNKDYDSELHPDYKPGFHSDPCFSSKYIW